MSLSITVAGVENLRRRGIETACQMSAYQVVLHTYQVINPYINGLLVIMHAIQNIIKIKYN